jgi:hypothetical protein
MRSVFNTVNPVVFSFAANTSTQRDRSRVTPIRGRNVLLCIVKARISKSYKGIDESCKIYEVSWNIMKSIGQILWRLHDKIYFLIEITHFFVLIFLQPNIETSLSKLSVFFSSWNDHYKVIFCSSVCMEGYLWIYFVRGIYS